MQLSDLQLSFHLLCWASKVAGHGHGGFRSLPDTRVRTCTSGCIHLTPSRNSVMRAGRRLLSEVAYSAKGLRTWTPANSKSLTLRVTTVSPCTRAVAAMSASITGRGCAYC